MSDTIKSQLETIYLELSHLAETSADAEQLHSLREQLGEVITRLPDGEQVLSFSDQLRAGIARFETEHPALAQAAEEIVDSLARLGI